MSSKSLFLVVLSWFLSIQVFGGKSVELKRVEPMNWWVGMKNPNLQVLVYGRDIASCDVKVDYPGVVLESITKVENPNYLFVDFKILPTAKAGAFDINFFQGTKLVSTYSYALNEREEGSANRKGFSSSDAIYLLMPDRFSNGDPSNDNIAGYFEKANRSEPYGRHGGDLKGVENHLDYIAQMGYTALWLNPVLENNLDQTTYHGYAITDFYNVDARLGTNEQFKTLTAEGRKRGMKMIMDMVFNHCGIKHWWMNDLPMKDWINTWPEYTQSYFRLASVCAPNASQIDRDRTVKGWFDQPMPDLNLENKYLLTYLTQNAIWWIEYAHLEGIRIDTYPYPNRQGMSNLDKAILTEYPNFNIVGECWISSSAKVAYYQAGFPHKDGFNSYLPSVMDFPLYDSWWNGFRKEEGWDDGLVRFYNIFSEDFLYPDPNNILLFPDNHDVSRIYSVLGKDLAQTKMVLTMVSTLRGYPQIYYGTELLMEGDGGNHASLRVDFPGGWPGDTINAFTPAGRTKEQNEMFDHISRLLNYRKNEPVLHTGKFTQFLPMGGLYVYSRNNDDKAVVVFVNNNARDLKVDTSRFNEVMKGFSKAKNVLDGTTIKDLSVIDVPSKTAVVVELTR